MKDTDYMALAVSLAERGRGWTNPNPVVGAVLVKEGRIIGQGWHRRLGGLHAEREALADCRESPEGATLYVTLEPCCHQGRQPPCTSAVLEAGIRRVVVGSADPNPLVAGKGLDLLRSHGVEVETGVLQAECDALNRVFFHYIRTGRPYVTMKYAMTLDGKIATRTGASQWITGEEARQRVHRDRHANATVLAAGPVEPERAAPFEAAGCQVWSLPLRGGSVDLAALMDRLGEAEIDSVLLEGGGTLNWAMLEAGLVRRVQAYIAPKLLGGAAAKSPVGGLGAALLEQAARVRDVTVTQAGEDFLLEGEIETDVYGNR